MNKLFDLRFVIGCFFLIVGILLLLYGFFSSATDQSVNRWCGGIFTLFGLIMLLLSYRRNTNDPGPH
ncbi:MAG: hypothetical protein B6D37_05310 [Sphingobacteriales bacterium UTBCD1]|jgi:uncharacterized membrane protein|nr:MAG: hypothetical protein B6D37_05310 [Sphingobacteriales bacterium UTBCD1]